MKKLLIVLVAAVMLIVGCQKLENQLINDALKSNDFYKALSTIDKLFSGYVYVIPSNGYLGTGTPVTAWREASNVASVESIFDNSPYNDAHVDVTAQDTLVVVFTDTGTVLDTVYKPSPTLDASIKLRFELVGDSWKLRTITKGVSKSDSALNHIAFDSVKVVAWRSGSPVDYPTLTQADSLMPYDTFLFDSGDSVAMDVWVTSDLPLPWVFGHIDANSTLNTAFQRDPSDPSHFYGFWKPTTAGRHVGWFEAVCAVDAFYSKTGPDRAVMWGMPYRVQ